MSYQRHVIKMKRQRGGEVVAGYCYTMPASTTDVRYVYFTCTEGIEDPRMLKVLDSTLEKTFSTYTDMLADMISLGSLGFRIVGEIIWSE